MSEAQENQELRRESPLKIEFSFAEHENPETEMGK
jgi:hypothetical protein